MKSLPSSTIRTALIDYRALLLRLVNTYPDTYKQSPQLIAEIDDALLSIEGNIAQVAIVPMTCAR